MFLYRLCWLLILLFWSTLSLFCLFNFALIRMYDIHFQSKFRPANWHAVDLYSFPFQVFYRNEFREFNDNRNSRIFRRISPWIISFNFVADSVCFFCHEYSELLQLSISTLLRRYMIHYQALNSTWTAITEFYAIKFDEMDTFSVMIFLCALYIFSY